jgi:hypothetical protein
LLATAAKELELRRTGQFHQSFSHFTDLIRQDLGGIVW